MRFTGLRIVRLSSDDAVTAFYSFKDQSGNTTEIEAAYRDRKSSDQSIVEAHTMMIVAMEKELLELKESKIEYVERAKAGPQF